MTHCLLEVWSKNWTTDLLWSRSTARMLAASLTLRQQAMEEMEESQHDDDAFMW